MPDGHLAGTYGDRGTDSRSALTRAGDAAPLDAGEIRAFIAICRGWKHTAPERTRP